MNQNGNALLEDLKTNWDLAAKSQDNTISQIAQNKVVGIDDLCFRWFLSTHKRTSGPHVIFIGMNPGKATSWGDVYDPKSTTGTDGTILKIRSALGWREDHWALHNSLKEIGEQASRATIINLSPFYNTKSKVASRILIDSKLNQREFILKVTAGISEHILQSARKEGSVIVVPMWGCEAHKRWKEEVRAMTKIIESIFAGTPDNASTLLYFKTKNGYPSHPGGGNTRWADKPFTSNEAHSLLEILP